MEWARSICDGLVEHDPDVGVGEGEMRRRLTASVADSSRRRDGATDSVAMLGGLTAGRSMRPHRRSTTQPVSNWSTIRHEHGPCTGSARQYQAGTAPATAASMSRRDERLDGVAKHGVEDNRPDPGATGGLQTGLRIRPVAPPRWVERRHRMRRRVRAAARLRGSVQDHPVRRDSCLAETVPANGHGSRVVDIACRATRPLGPASSGAVP